MCLIATFARAGTLTVTNINDSGIGSLRQALIDANALPDADTIAFNISGPGPHTITLLSSLGTVNNPVTIDGYTQPGASPNNLTTGDNALIKIQVSGGGVVTTGFQINSPGCVIRGLSLVNFAGNGIYLAASADTVVQGNFIGLDTDGATIRTNVGAGVRITSGNATIGGVMPAHRNLIAGNGGGGIQIVNAANNVIQGNYIGTDASGTQARPNQRFGLSIEQPNSSNNRVGGTNAAAGNIIAGTGNTGGGYGVYLDGCFNNKIEGNIIGATWTGTNALPNAGAGVLVTNALNNVIGGLLNSAGNVIAFNGGAGIRAPSGTNAFLGNLVYANAGLSIDIGTAGMSSNDNGDSDVGANALQNFPVLTGVTNTSNQTVFAGSLNSQSGQTYRLEFFSSPTNAPWARTFLATTNLTLGATNTAFFNFTFATGNLEGHYATATATRSNETSELAIHRAIVSINPPVIDLGPFDRTDPIESTVKWSVQATGAAPLQFQWYFNGAPITGATNQTLILTNLQMTAAGFYSVTVSNMNGVVSSQPAELTVAPKSQETWVARYNNTFDSGDAAKAMAVDALGNVYVTGGSVGPSSGVDFLTIKYGVNGQVIWTARYNGPGNGGDIAHSVAVDDDGNVYITGESVGSLTGVDFLTIKYNASGAQEWVARYAGPTNSADIASKVVVSRTGQVYVCGVSAGDFTTVSYSATGVSLWNDRYDGPAGGYDEARDLVVDNGGHVYVTGGAVGLTNAQDYATIKYDASGHRLWIASYSGPGQQNDVAGAIALDFSDHIVITGTSPGMGIGEDYATIQYDTDGHQLWLRRYNSPANKRDSATALALDQAGRAHVTGFVTATNVQTDFGTLKYDVDGTPLWTAINTSPSNDVAKAVAVDCIGNVYVTGYSFNGTNNDILTLKYDRVGNLIWQQRHNDGGVDEAYALVLDQLGNVIVSGRSANAASNDDFITIKYVQVGFPALVTQPDDAAVPEGTSVQFNASASSTRELFYQWQFHGTNLPGATNFSLLIESVAPADAGPYTLCVTNDVGGVLSRVAWLRVLPPQAPTVTQQPQSQSVTIGSAVTLSAEVIGTNPLTFQWRRNGINLVGETNATLLLPNVQVEDSGSYTLVIYGPLGATTTDPALIIVTLPALTFADNFADQIVLMTLAGQGRSSNVAATVELGEPAHAGQEGGKSIWISWLAPSNGIATFTTAGSSCDTLLAIYTGNSVGALTEIASDDDGGSFFSSEVQFNAQAGVLYRIAVDGLGGASGVIQLQFNLENTSEITPVILNSPLSQTASEGDAVSFSVPAGGPLVSYQWFFNQLPIANATSNVLTLTSVGETNVGRYAVRVSLGERFIRSRPVFLQLNGNGPSVQDVRAFDKFFEATDSRHWLRFGEGAAGASQPSGGGAVARGYTGTQIFSSEGATTEAGEPIHCSTPGGASQWFAYESQDDGMMLLNTDGSSFDTILAVYLGSGVDFAGLTEVACDNNGGTDGADSAVTFPTEAGTVYYIVVDGVNGATGKVKLNYNFIQQARLKALAMNPGGQGRVQITGQAGRSMLIQYSIDSITWQNWVMTNAPSSLFELVDPAASATNLRLYRLITLP